MTKIYQNTASADKVSFWVTRSGRPPVYFCIAVQLAVGSLWTEVNLAAGAKRGSPKEITPAAALDLLADWPEGLAELTAILADGETNETKGDVMKIRYFMQIEPLPILRSFWAMFDETTSDGVYFHVTDTETSSPTINASALIQGMGSKIVEVTEQQAFANLAGWKNGRSTPRELIRGNQ